MKVHIQYDESRMVYLVRVEYGEPTDEGVRRFASLTEGPPGTFYVRPGEEAPLYMRPIPLDIAEALGKALAPRPEATERHLDDALDVRDRLLTLIERGALGTP